MACLCKMLAIISLLFLLAPGLPPLEVSASRSEEWSSFTEQQQQQRPQGRQGSRPLPQTGGGGGHRQGPWKNKQPQQTRRLQSVEIGEDPPFLNELLKKANAENTNSNNRNGNDSGGVVLSQQLRNDLLQNYDRGSFPFEDVWKESSKGGGVVKGLEIEMGLNFYRIFELDHVRGVVDLIVWARLQWKDPRLVWDPLDYGNISDAFFWIAGGSGSGGETSEIWTPDIKLWNQESGLPNTLMDAHAKVSSDGTVFWSRPGRLRPVCKFKGLEDFPFDNLQCTMEFGSWAYSGKYLRLVKLYDGFTIGESDYAGESYSQFSLNNVSVEESIYPPYPSAPSEDWPVLLYHVSFRRAWRPYVRGYLTMQVLLNLVGFASMWLPVNCGERIGLVITSVLAAVASDLVVSSNLPASNEWTWAAKFTAGSSVFTFVVLFESALVIYLFYYTGKNLEPTWSHWIRQKRSPKTTASSSGFGHVGENDIGEYGDNVSYNDDDSSADKNKPTNKREISGDDVSSNGDDSSAYKIFSTHKSVTFEKAVRLDANGFKNLQQKENNSKWQVRAGYIDEGSRVIIPGTFVIFLAIMIGKANI